jgi:hypothetical protein
MLLNAVSSYLEIADTARLMKQPLHDLHSVNTIVAYTVTVNHLAP